MEVADAESFLDPRRSQSAARPGLRCCRGLGRGGVGERWQQRCGGAALGFKMAALGEMGCRGVAGHYL